MSNAVKQASEFGPVDGGQTMADLVVFMTDIHALGLKSAHGMDLAEAFYWDLTNKTREWSKTFFAARKAMPTMAQAGVYSATLHYLKAVKAAGTTIRRWSPLQSARCRLTTSGATTSAFAKTVA